MRARAAGPSWVPRGGRRNFLLSMGMNACIHPLYVRLAPLGQVGQARKDNPLTTINRDNLRS